MPEPLTPRRVLVVMPNWLGDVVMATPTLRALRAGFPGAQLTAMVRRVFRPVLEGCPWVDRLITLRPSRSGGGMSGRGRSVGALRARLRAGRFDLVLILPGGLRWALAAWLAGVPRRAGYRVSARGIFLTDSLPAPDKRPGVRPRSSTLDDYLALAAGLGASHPDRSPRVHLSPAELEAAVALLARQGWTPQSGRPLVVLNPGTSNREAKRWFPERFAAVGDRCAGEFGAVVAVNGSPTERGVVDAVHAAAKLPLLELDRLGVDIRLLKGVLSLASLVISNDTGTRHLAAALGTPCVSVFGPTDPALSHLGLAHDRHVRIEVPCGPCERDRCPLRDPAAHLACLRGVEVERVMAEARLWIGRRPPGHTPSSTTQAPPQALPRPDR